jgi:hypothetical protein
VYPGEPPLAIRLKLYGVPTPPAGRFELVLIWTADGPIAIEKVELRDPVLS